MARIYSAKQFANAVTRDINRKLSPRFKDRVEKAFYIAKDNLLEFIDSHDISRDFKSEGPIFGYFGFYKGSNPVGELLNFLNKNIDLKFDGIQENIGRVNVLLPDKESFRSDGNFKLPWESGKSWVEAIETGHFSNLDHYMYKVGKGNSGKGVQIKGTVKYLTDFKPKAYLTEAVRIFKKDIVRLIR